MAFAGGDGSAGNPYLVATAAQLNDVRNNLNKHFKQTADISLAGYQAGEGWVPIGTEATKFTGSYDGNGKQITGLKINRPSADYQGLFGYAGTSLLSNIKVTGLSIKGANRTGGFAAVALNITNCSLECTEVTGNSEIGGFVAWGRHIINCSLKCERITSSAGFAGGFLSGAETTTNVLIEGCYCEITDTVTATYAAGFISRTAENAVIRNCYCVVNKVISTGSNSITGGFMGRTYTLTIQNCYCQVLDYISSRGSCGGFIGEAMNKVNATNCYTVAFYAGGGATSRDAFINYHFSATPGISVGNFFDKTVETSETSDNAIGKTTAEMKTKSTFINAEWDFVDIWYQESGKYPALRAFLPYEAPANVTNFAIEQKNKRLIIKWADPIDTDNSIWEGTMLRRKTGGYPTNKNDGTLVVDSKVRSQYSVTGYEDIGLDNDTEYFYQAFPYSDQGLVNTNSANRISGTPFYVPFEEKTGALDDKGMNAGDPEDPGIPVKFMGIENIWGWLHKLVTGIKINSSGELLTGFDANEANYTNHGQIYTGESSANKYIKEVIGTNEAGFLVKETASYGSNTTYFADKSPEQVTDIDHLSFGGKASATPAEQSLEQAGMFAYPPQSASPEYAYYFVYLHKDPEPEPDPDPNPEE